MIVEGWNNKTQLHPQLAGLRALWNFSDEILNAVLWANTGDWSDKEVSIGYASEYIDFMEAVAGVNNPADAWIEWCYANNIEHEINSNPYL